MSGGWVGSTRRERLPADWDARRAEAHRGNPEHICHRCGEPGASELDHIQAGDDHRQDNLDWIHNRADYLAGRSARNCHGEKTAAEANTARWRRRRGKPEQHPAL